MTAASPPIAIIGGTGMLGRPVVRRLVRDGFAVRIIARDPDRARTLLPAECEFRSGDLNQPDDLVQALDGCRALYLNLACPMRKRPPAFEPERDGTKRAVDAAKQAGVERIGRISSVGVDEFAAKWWPAAHKREADQILQDSGLVWTIFRPTWFMESLMTMRQNGKVISINLGDDAKLRWLAGDDFGRMVAHAFAHDASQGRITICQGPERLTIPEAAARFAKAHQPELKIMRVPLVAMKLAGLFSQKMWYLAHLMEMTRLEFAAFDRLEHPTDLPKATMTIEDYVRYAKDVGDEPTK